MDNKLDNILRTDEVFHDGMDSAFSIQLHALIKEHGAKVIAALQSRLKDGRLSGQVACEVLIQCGHIAYGLPELEYLILQFASHGLNNSSVDVRDGAGLCIASIDNPIMIKSIDVAIGGETNPKLKENLEQALEQLIDTAQDSAVGTMLASEDILKDGWDD